MRTEYGIDLPTIHNYHLDAVRSGEVSWFVRWATGQILRFRASDEVREAKSTHFALEALSGVMVELQRTTTIEHAYIQANGLLKAEVERFHEFARLLENCFDFGLQSLRSTLGSRKGVKELIKVANEVDLAGGERVKNVRDHGFALRDKAPAVESFRIVSNATLEQLKEWHNPLRLDIVLSIMLDALPKLEDPVFRKLRVDAWGPMLVRHGMEDAATKLAASMNERRSAAAGTPTVNTPCSGMDPGSAFLYQTSNRVARQLGSSSPSVKEEGDESSERGEPDNCTPRASDYTWIPNSDYSGTPASSDSTPGFQPSFTQLFKPGPPGVREQRARQAARDAHQAQSAQDGTKRRNQRFGYETAFNVHAAIRRSNFAARLEGSTPVATPGTIVETSSPPSATPSWQYLRPASTVLQPTAQGSGASKGSFVQQQPSFDEEMSGIEDTVSVEDFSEDEDFCPDQDLSASEELGGDEEMSDNAE